MAGWEERAAGAKERYADGARRLPEDADERQRQLTRMGNAAWASGLCLLMLGREADGRAWLLRAAAAYRESWADAPPESWGRPIGALKCRLIAGDGDGAREDARWALEAGAAESPSPIGRYAAALAELCLGHDARAAELVPGIREADGFRPAVADALAALSRRDAAAYGTAIVGLVADFEARTEFLEDVPVADTVLALEALARERGLGARPASPLLPG